MFYRFSYFDSLAVSAGGLIGFQPYEDKNYTKTHVVGADFTSSGFTHSFRFEYLKFINNLRDIVAGSDLPFANFPVSINIFASNFFTGPEFPCAAANLSNRPPDKIRRQQGPRLSHPAIRSFLQSPARRRPFFL